jgi:hypothetical protein
MNEINKEKSGLKQCPECAQLVDSNSLKPLAINRQRAANRYVCQRCYARVVAARKIAREAAREALSKTRV